MLNRSDKSEKSERWEEGPTSCAAASRVGSQSRQKSDVGETFASCQEDNISHQARERRWRGQPISSKAERFRCICRAWRKHAFRSVVTSAGTPARRRRLRKGWHAQETIRSQEPVAPKTSVDGPICAGGMGLLDVPIKGTIRMSTMAKTTAPRKHGSRLGFGATIGVQGARTAVDN